MDSQVDGSSHTQKDVSVVTLIIKCPTNPSDFTIQMPVEATVLNVKQRLQRNYLGNPDPSRQRLIVAGVVLNEAVSIQDAFKQKNLEEPQVMHLSILPSPSSATPSSKPTASTSSASGASSAAQQLPPPSEQQAVSSSGQATSSSDVVQGPGGTTPTLPANPLPGLTPLREGSTASTAPHAPSGGSQLPGETPASQTQEIGSGSVAGTSQSADPATAAGGSSTVPEGGQAINPPDAFNQAVLQMMYGGGVLPLAFNPALAAFNAAALLNPAALLPLLYPGFFPAMYPAAYYPMAPPGGDPQAQNQTQGGPQPGGGDLPAPGPPLPFGMGPQGPVPGGLPGDPYGMLPMPLNFPFGAPFPMMAPAGAPPPNAAGPGHLWQMPPGGGGVQGQPRPEAEAVGVRQRHAPAAANGQPDVNAAGLRPPGARRQVVWHFRLQFRLDLMLILKLAIVVFVFNQDGSPDRLIFFITSAVLVYLYQTGALSPLVRWIRANTERALRPVQLHHPQPAPVQPQGPPQPHEGDGEQQVPPANEGQAEHVVVGNQPGVAPQGAAVANRIPGWNIVREISMFVLGFVTSLLPGFQGGEEQVAPQAPPVPRAPAQPAAGPGRPHQD